ncbi:MAG: isoprenylcysteine carboxylmethyltransferase family protein [Chitinophagaceae bacterium]
MNTPINKSKGPGVYFPPPLLYVLIFFVAQFLQKEFPIGNLLFHTMALKIIGTLFLVIAIFFMARSLRQFFLTKNTVILIKPANSLQTTGIYATTRNPMYVGLVLIYMGIACFAGNWWTFILLPILILIVQEYIIKREEKYLEVEFGQAFNDYRKKTRRWI